MGYVGDKLACAIDKAAFSGDVLTRKPLEDRVKGKRLASWKSGVNMKCAFVGFLTGLPGGGIGYLFLGADLAYLFAAAGEGCYGIGLIKGRQIDREKDLRFILALWCGLAKIDSGVAVGGVTAGKVAIKVGGKLGVKAGATYAGKVAAKPAGIAIAMAATNMLAKGVSKPIGKGAAKLIPVMLSKLMGALVGKLGATLIPLVGGIVSAAVNFWIANGLMKAAESYYSTDQIVFDEGDFDPVEFGLVSALDQV